MKVWQRLLVSGAILSAVTGSAFAFNQQGPVGHGPRGMPFDPVPAIIHLKDKLNLTMAQETQFQALLEKGKTFRTQAQSTRSTMKDALAAELAKDAPDFAALAAKHDAIHADMDKNRKTMRDEWLAFYNQMTPQQKLTVRDAIKERVAKFEQMRGQHQRPGA